MGILTDLLTAGGNLAITQEGIESAREIGQRGLDLSQQFGQQAADASRFVPFSVSTRFGGLQTGPSGGLTASLSPELEQVSSQLLGQGRNLLSSLSEPLTDRTRSIYENLSQIRAPQRQRDRLALENRLFNQGRSGVRTSQFGGTPEQLALAKAQQEQESADLFRARQLANQERLQDFNVGSGLFQSSFQPTRELMSTIQPSVALSDIAGTGARQGAQLRSMLQQSGLESLLQGETVGSNLRQAQLQGLFDAIQPTAQGLLTGVEDFGADLWDNIIDGIGNLFS